MVRDRIRFRPIFIKMSRTHTPVAAAVFFRHAACLLWLIFQRCRQLMSETVGQSTLIYRGLSCAPFSSAAVQPATARWIHAAADGLLSTSITTPAAVHSPPPPPRILRRQYVTSGTRLIDCRSFSVNFSPTKSAGLSHTKAGRKEGLERLGMIQWREEG